MSVLNKKEGVILTVIRRGIFLSLFMVIVLSGCQRGDQQDIAFLEDLGEDIASLFNSKKSDLHIDLSIEDLDDVGEKVTEGQEMDFNRKNQKRMDVLEADFVDAFEMFTLEEEVETFFEEDLVLKAAVDFLEIEKAEDTYESIDLKQYEKYDERVGAILVEAREQADQIILVEDLFDDLLDEEGLVREDSEVDREQLASEIKKIKNEEVRSDFEKKLVELDDSEETEELREEETEMESEVDDESDFEDEGNFSNSDNSNTSATSGNNSGWNSGNGGSNAGGSQGSRSSSGSSNSGGSGSSSGSGNQNSGSGNSGSGRSSEKAEPEDDKPKKEPEEEVEKTEKPDEPVSGGDEEDESSNSSGDSEKVEEE